MKPPKFKYIAPTTLADAVDLMAADPDAKLLSGGQSLMPLLAMRLATPSTLVDLQHVPGLSGIEDLGDLVRIGATVTHRSIERSALLAERIPMLPAAARYIAHPQIRSRGTLGGSMAHADPAGEWPVVLLALGATVRVVGSRGERAIGVDDFFAGPFTSTMTSDEILTCVDIPTSRTAWSFQEAAVKAGDYGLALVAVTATPRQGMLASPRVSVGGAVGSVTRLPSVEEFLANATLKVELADAAAELAAGSVTPISDIHGSSNYRRKLVGALVRRAVNELANGA